MKYDITVRMVVTIMPTIGGMFGYFILFPTTFPKSPQPDFQVILELINPKVYPTIAFRLFSTYIQHDIVEKEWIFQSRYRPLIKNV